MEAQTLRVTVVDGSRRDALATAEAVRRGIPGAKVEMIKRVSELVERLRTNQGLPPHIVISEHLLPDGSATDIISSLRRARIPVPVLIATGTPCHDAAVESLKAGASDFLSKEQGSLARLPQVILDAIIRHRKGLSESKRRDVLEQTTRVLRKKTQDSTDFIRSSAHELRTPMTVIRATIDNLLDGVYGEITPVQKDAMGKVTRNIDRLIRLVNDLLELSKIEAGQVSLERKEIFVKDFVEETLAPFLAEAARLRIRLTWDVAPADLVAFADADRLAQVLTNLVGNAFKFTPPDGDVRVEARPDKNRSGTILFRVLDSGVGIPAGHEDKIFDKFHQAPNQREGAQKGTGLGLAIAREIVRRHGGEIVAARRPTGGSAFVFSVPREAEKAGRELTVFIVDDHDDSLELLSRYIKSATAGKCHVTTAHDPREAIEYLSANRVDVVFSDICMPEIDGTQLLAQAKAKNPEVKVVLMTAYHEVYSAQEAQTLGADGYLAKPLSFKEIRGLLRSLISAGDALN